MPSALENLAPALLNASLPIHDATLKRFRLLLGKTATTNQHLAEIVRADIGFTLALLRQVNQPLPAEREAILKIDHAIALLGIGKTVEIADSLTPVSSLPTNARQALESLYSCAWHAAQYFEALAVQCNLPHARENTHATRLMNLAAVTLWVNRPEVMQAHLKNRQSPPDNAIEPLDYELRTLGLALAREWRLPEELQQALSPDIAWQQLPLCIALADATAWHTGENWHSPYSRYLFELWSELAELPQPHIAEIIHRLSAETARQIHDLHLPLPAFYLLQLPPEPEPETKSEPVQLNTQTATTSAPTTQKPTKSDTPGNMPEPAAATAARPAGQTNLLQATLAAEMRQINDNVGIRRVLFALLTPDRKQLKVRFVRGGDKTDAFRKFTVSLQQRSLFSLLMEKPQGIWLKPDNHEKYLALIPATLRNSLNTANLFAMSLFIKGKPVGLLLADHDAATLSAEQYRQFKQSCLNITHALSGEN